MSTGAENLRCAAALVDELARGGLRRVVVGPGSRSAPLAQAFAEDSRVRVWVHPDERSGAYYALGLAKAGRAPVALLCTSGTAAANFFPAVVEARYGRVPLVVLTADRPPELRDVGAPQAIDQLRLYGAHALWFAELPLPDGRVETLRAYRATACRALAAASGSPAGPVHLNVPFREPLLPEPDELPLAPPAETGRPDGAAWVRLTRGRRALDRDEVQRLAAELDGVERGLVVCGPHENPALAAPLAALARRLGWPLLADGLSPLRTGTHDRARVLDSYDAILRDAAWAGEHAPELVLRFGAAPTSKPLAQLLERSGARLIVVDDGEGWRDPALLAGEMIHSDAVLLGETLARELPAEREPSAWLEAWLGANEAAHRAIREACAALGEPFEGRLFALLAEVLPDGATLWVGNSMPVRDLDTFFPAGPRRVRALCNRGANGIDGAVSGALGASATGGGPTVLATGDLSFLHDSGGLLGAKLWRLDLTVLLINNDGGGIFSFLPQRQHPATFEQLYGTPTGLEFRALVEAYEGRHVEARTDAEVRVALCAGIAAGGLQVVEVRTDRERNVALHRGVWRAVAAALDAAPATAVR